MFSLRECSLEKYFAKWPSELDINILSAVKVKKNKTNRDSGSKTCWMAFNGRNTLVPILG